MSPPHPSEFLSIDALARTTGATSKLIRLYERQGLLVPIDHDGSQVYSRHDEGKLKTVLALRELGFGIKQMRALFATYQVEALSDLLKISDFSQFLREHMQQLKVQQEKVTQQLARVKAMLDTMPSAIALYVGCALLT